ncbi:MAG: AAA family ATPase [Gammaproteobacteria bacterium]
MYLRLNPYDEILQGIVVGLQIDEGIIKITGRKGSGKTALCNRLCEDLQANGHPAILFGEPPSSAIALQQAVVDRLQLDASGNFTRALSAWLLARNTEEKPLVLIFDDAQRLDPPTFSAIRMLCNIQSGARSLVRVVLCGSDELDARIAAPALRAVTQFISQSFTLPFLTREQVRDFCQAYCLQAGHDIKALDERAVDRLFHDTKGQPGMLYARLEQERAVQADERGAAPEFLAAQAPEAPAVQALPDEHGDDRTPPRPRARAIAAGLLVVIVGIGAGAYLYVVPPVPASQETAARGDVDAAPSPASNPAAVAGEPVAEPAPELPAVAEPPEVPAAVASADITIGDISSDVPDTIGAPSVVQAIDGDESVAPPAPAAEASALEAQATASRATAPVDDFIANWIASWQAQDVDGYLAHYHRDFAPMQGSRAGWEQQRRRVIESASDLVITADAPQSITEAQDGMRVVRFWLNYRAANYGDRTLKELVLAPVDGEWRIRAERNLLTEAQ